MPNKVNCKDGDTKFCDDMLGKVSRSFASVIRQLPKGLCLDILIFYLALRALDTIEDDMEAFKDRESVKIDHLNNFYRTGLVTDGWHMEGVGLGDERTLLEQYFRCVTVFKGLSAASQEVIADITKRMGEVIKYRFTYRLLLDDISLSYSQIQSILTLSHVIPTYIHCFPLLPPCC